MTAREAVRAAIGLGGNIGDVATTLHSAARALDALPHTGLHALSRLYRTPAWGVEAQPDFINAVALIDTTLAPKRLLSALLAIERRHGRDRARETRWGPRTLDLDLLLYGDAELELPGLTVPHPRMHERAFVLLPLLELAGDAVIPGRGPAAPLLQALDCSAIRPLDGDGDGVPPTGEQAGVTIFP